MLIKPPDDKSKRLKLLEELTKSDRLDDRQKHWLRQELRRMQPGIVGERDAVHYLDMSFSESKNHAILHDLRLEADGQTAQIDHLVVDRTLVFFLLETKTYRGSLHINEHGEFMVEYADERRYGIESPLEQSRRHEKVLEKVLERVGICGRAGTKPTFVHVVMVHPKGIIHRPDHKKFDSSMVIKADQFATWHEKYVDKLGLGSALSIFLNVRSRETVKEWGELLWSEHRAANLFDLPDFMKPQPVRETRTQGAATPDKKRGEASFRDSPCATETKRLQNDENQAAIVESAERNRVPSCAACGKQLTPKVAKYCADMSPRFGGKYYCFDHQKMFSG